MDQAHPMLASCFPSFVTVKSVQNVLPPFIVFYEVIIKSISQCQMNYMVYWSIIICVHLGARHNWSHVSY